MFMVNRISNLFFGGPSKETIIEIPDGQLYVVRPLSVQGYSDLIYKSAKVQIRRTATEFQYQLVVTRIYEEGEAELLAESADDDALDALDNDEQSFLLDEALQFRVEIRDTGEKVFAWRDLTGAKGDLWEFVCAISTKAETVEAFDLLALRCQYERKYKQSGENATDDDLRQFYFSEEPIPAASPILHPTSASPNLSPSATSAQLHTEAAQADDTMPSKLSSKGKAMDSTPAAPVVDESHAADIFCKVMGELHFYEVEAGHFIMLEHAVMAVVMDLGDWNYWLKIKGNEHNISTAIVQTDLNPVFNFEFLSAIFNVTRDSATYSYLLRFKDEATLGEFQHAVMQAAWEQQNTTKWAKVKDVDQEYILDAFNDLTMEDAPEEVPEEAEEEEEESEDEGHSIVQDEEYDTDESQDGPSGVPKDGNVNSQLAVGQMKDRAFVVRGSKIGVFKQGTGSQLEFVTNISKVATPKGKLFSPQKVMLHAGDSDLILQHQDNPNAVFRMDLNRGEVVEEYKVHDDIQINHFAPDKKFADDANQQEFLGFSKNAMYRVDTRLDGNKMVDVGMKQYASKTGFNVATTTEKGYIAVASENGDIRLYDKLGLNAKTQLPGLGEPVTGLDTSADGRWVLATQHSSLLLIDTKQKEGKWEGSLGFEKAFPKDKKPQPRRLALKPEHVAQYKHETKNAPIKFTPAKFNTGKGSEETTIVTSTGPFVISWNLKKVLQGRKEPYSMKRYSDDVKADNFRFNSDKGIIVALPNEVDMVMKKHLKNPRESLAAPPVNRRSSARNYLGRNDIVNSPY